MTPSEFVSSWGPVAVPFAVVLAYVAAKVMLQAHFEGKQPKLGDIGQLGDGEDD
ncbi:hypothetical protein [Salarchaeum japonicum]|uniref:Uncharacterized protein n=1 Tax=Salarchaeum japonicum TaxID=555573 RepID=A0AAV3SYZ5_9EURY|nr:hypothetical protein [Salarchaeum japonicum]